MRFYTQQHLYYCGVDLHARSLYVCILDQAGAVQVHQNLRASPEEFLQIIAPYRQDIAVAAECMFSWYWLADLCEREGIPFVLGHALYMKAIPVCRQAGTEAKPKTTGSTPTRSPPSSAEA